MAADGIWVAGVDGCRGGWLVVLRYLSAPAQCRSFITDDFSTVLTLPENPAVIAVDMPIGLPEVSGPGGRICDNEARATLGTRRSALFAVPARDAVQQTDYQSACLVASRRSDPPRKVSKQCFNLFPKIRQLDALLSPRLQARVVECHPEVAFWALNGEQPMAWPKKIESRPHQPGLDARRRLLEHAGFPPGILWETSIRRSKAGLDDVLDACACAWTAGRISTGAARRFPAQPPLDARGLRMEIWA